MLEREIPKIVNWLREKVTEAHAEGLVIGLSGGVDSAVAAAISKLAYPDNTLVINIPINSNPRDNEDAKLVAQAIELAYHELDLTKEHQILREKLLTKINLAAHQQIKQRLVDANLRARLRMSVLYAAANALNYLVIGTDNKSEYYTGYFTKFGDGACDVLPLVDFTKSEIIELASLLNIPDQIINKPPSAGLWAGQTDEVEMGTTYGYIDAYLRGEQIPEKDSKIIMRLHANSAHKRTIPYKYFRSNMQKDRP